MFIYNIKIDFFVVILYSSNCFGTIIPFYFSSSLDQCQLSNTQSYM